MMMRGIAASLAVTLAAAGMAQQASYGMAREWVTTALQPLSASQSIRVELVGEEVFGSDAPIPVALEATIEKVRVGESDTAMMDVRVFRAGQLLQRLVGDGEMGWSYSSRSQEYVSGGYQSLESPRSDFLSRMLLMGSRWGGKEADFALRLAKDVFAGGEGLGSRWSPWVSGLSQVSINQPDDNTTNVSFESLSSQTALNYVIVRSDVESPWILDRVQFAREQMVGNTVQRTAWEAVVLPDHIPSTVSYVFRPPAGARARGTGG